MSAISGHSARRADEATFNVFKCCSTKATCFCMAFDGENTGVAGDNGWDGDPAGRVGVDGPTVWFSGGWKGNSEVAGEPMEETVAIRGRSGVHGATLDGSSLDGVGRWEVVGVVGHEGDPSEAAASKFAMGGPSRASRIDLRMVRLSISCCAAKYLTSGRTIESEWVMVGGRSESFKCFLLKARVIPSQIRVSGDS